MQRQQFPSVLERTTADTLLLLSLYPPKVCSEAKKIGKVSSVSSSLGAISEEKILPHELKVMRKTRSKVHHISDCRKVTTTKPAAMSSTSLSTEASCLSSTSSGASSARITKTAPEIMADGESSHLRVKRSAFSASLRQRADAILRFLATRGCTTEKKIREVLGDSPASSKALRMLLKLQEVKRSGLGGPQDPYKYMIA